MGCISSKILTKSLSFRGDINQRSKKKTVASGILDELFVSDNGNGTKSDHQFFALVNKLQIGDSSNLPPKSGPEPANTETINTWELMAGLEEQVEQKQETESSKILDLDKMKRSKSCEFSTVSKLVLGVDGLSEDQFQWENKSMGRSKSFHTVEEYDAMIEKILLSSTHNDDYGSANVQLHSIHNSKHNVPEIIEVNSVAINSEPDIKEVNPMILTSEPEVKEMLPSHISSSSRFKDVCQEKRSCDTGFKRKALAKGLGSLQIPSMAEFRSGSLREWLHGAVNVSSPGEYVTPKFGNYNKQCSGLGAESRDESIFNPELVAAFEEFLQKLEVEEESVLAQFEGNHDDITANEVFKKGNFPNLQY